MRRSALACWPSMTRRSARASPTSKSSACLVQRGNGGARIEPGEGFVAMAFRHRMSRAGDPALHVHVLVSNLTRAASDGRWLTLASPKGRSPLWTHGKSAGVVFQAALRAGILREFGLDFEAVRHGYADIRGFSREVIEAFSTRSQEIGKWLEEHGVSSVAAAQTAAYRTRDAKDYGVDADERSAEWIEQAATFGLTPAGVREMTEQGRPPRAAGDHRGRPRRRAGPARAERLPLRPPGAALGARRPAARGSRGGGARSGGRPPSRLRAGDLPARAARPARPGPLHDAADRRARAPLHRGRPRRRRRQGRGGRPARRSRRCWGATPTSAPTSARWSCA